MNEARRRDFAVILVPEKTQLPDITRAAFQSRVGIESATFQRLSSLQQNLMRALNDPKPLEAMVQRLGRLVNSTIVVMTSDGKVEAATGALPSKSRSRAARSDSWTARPVRGR